MNKYTKVIERDRQLSLLQSTTYQAIEDDYNDVIKQIAMYGDDPNLEELKNEIIGLYNKATTLKDNYLADKDKQILTYEIDMDKVQKIRDNYVNFEKLVVS